MSSLSDRPVLSEVPESDAASADDVSRTLTGVRRKSPSMDDAALASTVAADARSLESVGPPPDSLRKPFAVLTSPARTESLPPPSFGPQSFGPQSGVQTTPPGSRTPSESKRSSDTTSTGRKAGVCPKHGIARNPAGECLLCAKEAPRKSNALFYALGGLFLVVAVTLLLLK